MSPLCTKDAFALCNSLYYTLYSVKIFKIFASLWQTWHLSAQWFKTAQTNNNERKYLWQVLIYKWFLLLQDLNWGFPFELHPFYCIAFESAFSFVHMKNHQNDNVCRFVLLCIFTFSSFQQSVLVKYPSFHKHADILHIFNLNVVFSNPRKEKVFICHGKIYKWANFSVMFAV